MRTIEDQIELEKRMVAFGVSRYRFGIEAAERNERSHETRYAQKLMQEFVVPVAEALEEYTSTSRPGVQGKYRALLRKVEPYTAAYISLRCVFSSFLKSPKLISMAASIGQALEDELKFSIFHEEEGDYYEAIIKDFKRKGTKNYRHMHRVLTLKANEKDISWASWSQEERVGVGVKMIDLILSYTDLIEKESSFVRNKTVVNIHPTAECLEWIKKFNAYASLLHPDRMPCVIPPDDWEDVENGGYFTPQMRSRSPLVKTRYKEHKALLQGDLTHVTEAVNHLQNTAWSVNKKVFRVLELAWYRSLAIGLPRSQPYVIPSSPVAGKKKADFSKREMKAFDEWKAEARAIHTMERERVSKCFEIVRLVRLAQEYEQYDAFWFVWQCDFRGRMYCTTSGLSPQGADPAKACLQFAKGKRLTERGAYWLKVHGANCYGVDKVSYEDRLQWVKDNHDGILAVAEDPMSNVKFWGNADSPWQFLAFCFEYQRLQTEGIGMLSYLPVGMDGSCNGLQHFSAMLRDQTGGESTNLVKSGRPTDIYSEVSKVCYNKLLGLREQDEKAAALVGLSTDGKMLPRSLAKRPVMTLPYGSTRQSCTEALYAYFREECTDKFDTRDMFRLSTFLTPILWESIGDVVKSAMVAMGWIQSCASLLAKANKPIVWWTPIGFPVYQGAKKLKLRQIHTELCGRFQITVGTPTDRFDVMKNRQGSSPNFVHSMDACHAMLTILRAYDFGVTDFAFIHDDFGCHASDIDYLQQAIRETFVELYTENDPMLDFKMANETDTFKLPELPRRGTLNLEEVIDSDYFFS